MKPLNNFMDNANSGKSGRKRKPKATPPIPPVGDELLKPTPSTPPVEDSKYMLDIKNLINEVLQENIHESGKKRRTHNITQSLVSTVTEFLDCFSLIGYTPNGNPVVLSYSKTPIQEDALKSLLIKFTHFVLNKSEQLGSDNSF